MSILLENTGILDHVHRLIYPTQLIRQARHRLVRSDMPRFVILEHDYPSLHWDLMLEAGEILRTWRLQEVPEPGKRIAAEASFDHRKVYLNYEGPISGNRGTVRRWDEGEYHPTLGENTAEAILDVTFYGKRLHGRASVSVEAAGSVFYWRA
jgi:hypothetical protein